MEILPLEGELRFTNSGKMELFFLGTGSAFVKENFQTNLLIIKGNDHLLIDCGTLCPFAFHSYKSSVVKVKNIFLTHSHSDHIGGVEELALLHKYGDKIRPKMIVTDRYKRILWLQSLRGGLMYGEQDKKDPVPDEKRRFLTFEDYFEQIKPRLITKKPRDMYEAQIGEINVKMFRTMHIPGDVPSWRESAWSCGVILNDKILFSGDTRFDPELITWLEKQFKIDYIFHDCQAFTGGVHAALSELETFPAATKEKMYLCHYSDNFSNFDAKAHGFAGLTERGVYYCVE